MKQSVDLMNSMKLMNSRHSNTTTTTTSLARRALLLLSLFVMSVGAWADFTPASLPSSAVYTKEMAVAGLTYEFDLVSQASAIKTALGGNVKYARWFIVDSDDNIVNSSTWTFTQGLSPWNDTWYNGAKDGDGNGYIYWGIDNDPTNAYGRRENYLKMTITAPTGTDMTGKKIIVVFSGESNSSPNEPTLSAMCVFDFPAPDVFGGSAKSESVSGTDITKYLTIETQLPLDITKATAKLGGTAAKYARFYVLHNGVAENLKTNTTLLEISGVTPAAQNPSKGIYGYYLYNSGSDLNLSGLTVKLNAATGEFPDYQVVCLLSTDAAKAATGNVVSEEPDWDVVFTYSFRNQTVTKNQTGSVAWDAVAMTAAVPATDLANDWGTSWANLAQEQKVQWYVVNSSDEVQPLAIGTARQDDTWTINLPSPFAVTSNVAILTGQNTYTAATFEGAWATWGNPAVYAPANKSFADVQDYKIICKIADDGNALAVPNVVYTLSLTNVLNGQEKTGMTKTTTQVKLDAVTDVTKDIAFTLPTGTKYARFYVVDENGTALNATDAAHQLTIAGGNIYSDNTMGYYLYNESGLSLSSVTFSCSSANLNDYQVIMLTSTETAVNSGGVVTYEPDYESMTTFWFNYPATAWNPETNVEWSPQSMQVDAPDIETEKGAGYLEKNRKHYTLQWQVVDKNGVAQPLRKGNDRTIDYWTVNINGDMFSLADANTLLTVSNIDILDVSYWNKWTKPVFFAPKNKTMKEIADEGYRFVCKFYEDDDASDVNMLAMTYTVFIDRTNQPGQLKDGGKRGGETITTLTSTTTNLTIDLTKATDAFLAEMGQKATYARVYLTKNDGTMLDPTTAPETLTSVGGTAFTTKEYGYYFQDEANGVTLPTDASLTLPAGKFSYYYVVVAMTADTGEDSHTGAFSREFSHRAASITSPYEPDYDYIYTIKFTDTSTWPGTEDIDYSHSKEVLVASESVTTANMSLSDSKAKILTDYSVSSWATLRSNFHIRWYIAKKNDEGDYVKIPASEKYLTATTPGKGHQSETDQGLYWNSVTQTYAWPGSLTESDVLNVTINRNPGGGAPELTGNWEDYKVIAVMTKDLTGQTDDGGSPKVLTHEPNTLDMIYRFSFFKETQFQFVHDTGAGTNVFMKKANDARINATVQQYSWDNGTSSRTPETGDVRQWVHTMEYDVYVDPSSSTPVMLHLPFEKYTSTGNNLEPAAYIRWYDWATDINNNRLTKVGTRLVDMTETNNGVNVSRGFFFLNNDENGLQPTHDMVGVTFNPNGVDGLVTIACDVSKYYDGIYSGSTGEYLMHEPTLSTRYIFNIRPASVIAGDIKIGQQKFEAAGSSMFDLAEDNGRVCVSMKNTSSEFTVRSALPTLDSYYFYDGSTLVNANKIAWVPYYVDEDGSVWKFNGYFDGANTNRIKQFIVSSMTGTYLSVADGTTTKTVTVGSGTRSHISNSTRKAKF